MVNNHPKDLVGLIPVKTHRRYGTQVNTQVCAVRLVRVMLHEVKVR